MNAVALMLLLAIHDVNGVDRQPLRVNDGKGNVLFFITDECPISNAFAHEIARICGEYKSKNIGCDLVYADATLSDDQARKHAQDYGHGDYPRIVDRAHELVKATGVTVTPEAAVISGEGKVVYRGRIDDSFAALTEPRRPATSPDLRNALDELIAGKLIKTPETKPVGCYISDFGVTHISSRSR